MFFLWSARNKTVREKSFSLSLPLHSNALRVYGPRRNFRVALNSCVRPNLYLQAFQKVPPWPAQKRKLGCTDAARASLHQDVPLTIRSAYTARHGAYSACCSPKHGAGPARSDFAGASPPAWHYMASVVAKMRQTCLRRETLGQHMKG